MFGNTGLCLLYLFIFEYLDQIHSNKGSSIYYVRKIFRKTNISTRWYAHARVRIRELEIFIFLRNFAYALNG